MEENRIVLNQKIMVGKPIIRGTRIPVDLIVRLVAQGATVTEILENYPNLTKEDIRAALRYAAKLAEGEIFFPLKEENA